ncbi:hypothetical protein [Micromonospora sp. NPDC023956]|uniref:hypothetical protein n=1 Tax=Micromonospora sp. NPDC023956 TaxID=3155722 RepID=UPI00341195B2
MHPGNGSFRGYSLHNVVSEWAVRDDVLDHRRVHLDLSVVLGERDVPVDDVVEQDLAGRDSQPSAGASIEY